MSARIDRKAINKVCDFAEKLGLRVVHIHADVKTPGEGCRIKIELQDRGKK